MADELINSEEYEVVDNTKLYIGMKRLEDDFLIAATEEEYAQLDLSQYEVDGIIIRNEEKEVDLLFATYEVDAIAGEGPEDIPETDKRRKNALPNPTFTELDGEQQTQWQLDNHPETHEEGCAICEAVKFGWLPSCGEMSWARDYKDDFNALAELVGGTSLSESEYWTSTQYSLDYMWSMDADGVFIFWRCKETTMKVRPVKSASDYQVTVTE